MLRLSKEVSTDDAIDDLRRREIQAAEAGDVQRLLELRTDDFVAMPPGHPPVRGKEEVANFLNGMFGAASIQETVTSERVAVAGDLAYDRGVYHRDRTLTDSKTVTVVGVLPEDFRFDGRPYAFWIPLTAGGGAGPGSRVDVLARLRPGVARAEAEERLRSLARSLTAREPDAFRNVAVRPLRERLGLGAGEGRGALLGVTGLVLLIAVMNVAGLSWIPARRALAVDPVVALRTD